MAHQFPRDLFHACFRASIETAIFFFSANYNVKSEKFFSRAKRRNKLIFIASRDPITREHIATNFWIYRDEFLASIFNSSY